MPSPVLGPGDTTYNETSCGASLQQGIRQIITQMDVIRQLLNEFIYENVLILKDSIVLEMSACVLSVPREP